MSSPQDNNYNNYLDYEDETNNEDTNSVENNNNSDSQEAPSNYNSYDDYDDDENKNEAEETSRVDTLATLTISSNNNLKNDAPDEIDLSTKNIELSLNDSSPSNAPTNIVVKEKIEENSIHQIRFDNNPNTINKKLPADFRFLPPTHAQIKEIVSAGPELLNHLLSTLARISQGEFFFNNVPLNINNFSTTISDSLTNASSAHLPVDEIIVILVMSLKNNVDSIFHQLAQAPKLNYLQQLYSIKYDSNNLNNPNIQANIKTRIEKTQKDPILLFVPLSLEKEHRTHFSYSIIQESPFQFRIKVAFPLLFQKKELAANNEATEDGKILKARIISSFELNINPEKLASTNQSEQESIKFDNFSIDFYALTSDVDIDSLPGTFEEAVCSLLDYNDLMNLGIEEKNTFLNTTLKPLLEDFKNPIATGVFQAESSRGNNNNNVPIPPPPFLPLPLNQRAGFVSVMGGGINLEGGFNRLKKVNPSELNKDTDGSQDTKSATGVDINTIAAIANATDRSTAIAALETSKSGLSEKPTSLPFEVKLRSSSTNTHPSSQSESMQQAVEDNNANSKNPDYKVSLKPVLLSSSSSIQQSTLDTDNNASLSSSGGVQGIRNRFDKAESNQSIKPNFIIKKTTSLLTTQLESNNNNNQTEVTPVLPLQESTVKPVVDPTKPPLKSAPKAPSKVGGNSALVNLSLNTQSDNNNNNNSSSDLNPTPSSP